MRVLLSSHTGWGSCLLACLPPECVSARYVPCSSMGYWKGFFPTYRHQLDEAIKDFRPDVLLADDEDAGSFLLAGQAYGLKILGHPIQKVLARDWEFVDGLLARSGHKRVHVDGPIHKNQQWLLQYHHGLDVKEMLLPGDQVARYPAPTRRLHVTGPRFTVTGFFDGDTWVDQAVVSYEHRLVSHHEVVDRIEVFPLSSNTKLFKVTLAKLSTFLKSVAYVGPLGMRCVLQNQVAQVLDLVPRWPDMLTEVLVYCTPMERLISRLAGWVDDPWSGVPVPLAGYRVAFRPYPVETGTDIPLSVDIEMPTAPPGIVWGQVRTTNTGVRSTGPRVGVSVGASHKTCRDQMHALTGMPCQLLPTLVIDPPLQHLVDAGLLNKDYPYREVAP